jgi:hypothetical protein
MDDRERTGGRATMDVWTFSTEPAVRGADLVGFSVEAIDGSIGKIDEATEEVGRAHLIVDTGPWIFGKKVMLPAGVIDRIDPNEEKVYVHRTKDEIKNAPEYDDSMADDDSYRGTVGGYYGSGGAGWRDWDNRAF